MNARRIGLLLLMLSAVACESGPEGPGSFAASVVSTGPSVGAVIVEVTGEGIQGFEGTGDTQVFSSITDPAAGSHRLIAVSGGGTITFRVRVDRVELGYPAATVLDAVDTDNAPRGPSGASIQFSG